MTLQADLIRTHEEIAGRQARIAQMVAEGKSATGAKSATLLDDLTKANRELHALIERRDALGSQVEMARLESDAIKASRRPGERQVEPELGNGSDDDLPAGTVRAMKSVDKFTTRFGGTSVSLDQYLKAALSGDWSRIPAAIKDMSVGSDLLGGYTVPEPLANRVIDLSRAASRVIQAGAITVPMTAATLRFARLLTEPTAAWKNENALITASDATFEPVTLTARTLAARVVISVELSDDSPTVGNVIENSLSAALAGELDRSALLGSGTPPEPQGLIGTPGVEERPVSAGLPNIHYGDFSYAVQSIREADQEPNAVIYGPDVAGALDRLVDSTGQPLQPPASFADLRKFTTSRLAETAAIGDWTQFVVGMRQELRIEGTRLANDENGKGFSSYSVLIRATLRADFAVLKPSAFIILTDITEAGS